MTTLRLLDDFRVLAVATPDYLARHPTPSLPKDLHAHNCIRYRLPWDGSIQPWVFNKGLHRTEIAVEGSLIVNNLEALLGATLEGIAIAYLAQPMIAHLLAE